MQIGPYEIIGELARGGMAIVYRAHDPRANRTVALKLLQINDHAKRTRFLREVRSLMLLRHRYLVAAHDAGEAGGYPYLVLDLVEGESLQAQLDRETRLDPDLAVSHVRKLAEAIDYANREGVVHRDLKPENVLIDTQGEPRLTDFGLVKFTSSESLESLSKTGKMYGTPGFWSPEQAAGESDRIGPATDVYGLGATLYACLTGEAPIQGETLVELLIATRNQTPEPAGVDRKLDAICLRCLAKEPADRFASAGELNQALLDWEESPPGRELGRGPLVVLAGALGALALTLALAIGSSPATTPEQTLAAAPQESASSPAPSLPATPSPLASPTGSRDPLSAEEWMRRGVALELSLDRDRAIQAYSRAIELEPATRRPSTTEAGIGTRPAIAAPRSRTTPPPSSASRPTSRRGRIAGSPAESSMSSQRPSRTSTA
ncbi:MAG: protein kinase [Planctomycetes bacterium]|nr:protein kinase [Planctomycetota bacterium]